MENGITDLDDASLAVEELFCDNLRGGLAIVMICGLCGFWSVCFGCSWFWLSEFCYDCGLWWFVGCVVFFFLIFGFVVTVVNLLGFVEFVIGFCLVGGGYGWAVGFVVAGEYDWVCGGFFFHFFIFYFLFLSQTPP